MYNRISKKTKDYPKWRIGALDDEFHKWGIIRAKAFFIRYRVELSTRKFEVFRLVMCPDLYDFQSELQQLRPVIISLTLGGSSPNFDPLTFLKPNGSLLEALELIDVKKIESTRLPCLKGLNHLKRILIKTFVVPLMRDLLVNFPLEINELTIHAGNRSIKRPSIDFTYLNCFKQLTLLDLTLDDYGLVTLCEGYFPNVEYLRVNNIYKGGNDSSNEKRDNVCVFPNLRELLILGRLPFDQLLNVSGMQLRYLTIVPYIRDCAYFHRRDYDYTERVGQYGPRGVSSKFYNLLKLIVPGDEELLKQVYPDTEITTGLVFAGADVYEERRWPYYSF